MTLSIRIIQLDYTAVPDDLYDHELINKAYLGDITATNIYKSFTHKMVAIFFTHKMAAKTSWHRHETKLHHCHSV